MFYLHIIDAPLLTYLFWFISAFSWAAIIALFLQFAFKLVVGEKNEYRDAYRICSIVFIIEVLLHIFLSSIGIVEPLIGVGLFTYLIAKEIGDLRKSLLIAFVLQGLFTLGTYLFLLLVVLIGAMLGGDFGLYF